MGYLLVDKTELMHNDQSEIRKSDLDGLKATVASCDNVFVESKSDVRIIKKPGLETSSNNLAYKPKQLKRNNAIKKEVIQLQQWTKEYIQINMEKDWVTFKTVIDNHIKENNNRNEKNVLAYRIQNQIKKIYEDKRDQEIQHMKTDMDNKTLIPRKKRDKEIENKEKEIMEKYNQELIDINKGEFIEMAQYILEKDFDWSSGNIESNYIKEGDNLQQNIHPTVSTAVPVSPPANKEAIMTATGLDEIEATKAININKLGNQLSSHLLFSGGALFHRTYSHQEKTFFYENFNWAGEMKYFLIAYGYHTDEVQKGKSDPEHHNSYKLEWVCENKNSFTEGGVITL